MCIYIYRCVCECALNMLKNTSYSFTDFQTPVYSNPRATNNSTTTEPATVCCTPQSILLTVFQKPKTRLQTHVKYVRQRRKNHSQSKKTPLHCVLTCSVLKLCRMPCAQLFSTHVMCCLDGFENVLDIL